MLESIRRPSDDDVIESAGYGYIVARWDIEDGVSIFIGSDLCCGNVICPGEDVEKTLRIIPIAHEFLHRFELDEDVWAEATVLPYLLKLPMREHECFE